MDLVRSEHHIYYAKYHYVWTPKYRHPVFQEPYRTTLKEIILKTGYDYDLTIHELEIPTDHVHVLVSFAPPVSISHCIRILKSISAREFFQRYPDIKHKYFWGGKLWSPSYYVETIGDRNERAIASYIKNQLVAEQQQLAQLQQLKLFPQP